MLVQNYLGPMAFSPGKMVLPFRLKVSKTSEDFENNLRFIASALLQYILSKMIVESTTASLTCPPPSPSSLPGGRPTRSTWLHKPPSGKNCTDRDFSRFSDQFPQRHIHHKRWERFKLMQCIEGTLLNRRCLTETVQFLEFPGFELNLNSCIRKDDQILSDSKRDWKDINQLNKSNET